MEQNLNQFYWLHLFLPKISWLLWKAFVAKPETNQEQKSIFSYFLDEKCHLCAQNVSIVSFEDYGMIVIKPMWHTVDAGNNRSGNFLGSWAFFGLTVSCDSIAALHKIADGHLAIQISYWLVWKLIRYTLSGPQNNKGPGICFLFIIIFR